MSMFCNVLTVFDRTDFHIDLEREIGPFFYRGNSAYGITRTKIVWVDGPAVGQDVAEMIVVDDDDNNVRLAAYAGGDSVNYYNVIMSGLYGPEDIQRLLDKNRKGRIIMDRCRPAGFWENKQLRRNFKRSAAIGVSLHDGLPTFFAAQNFWELRRLQWLERLNR